MSKVPNDDLLRAGLELMEKNGKPLVRVESFGRAMMYRLPDGKTVRVRTCNDHILVVLADSPKTDAKLNIEGTDFLLIVMPEQERTPGKVWAFLVPTHVAVDAARSTHRDWLKTNPNTKGDNRTWNLWFDEGGKASGFANKWRSYQLAGDAFTNAPRGVGSTLPPPIATDLKSVVESSRQAIAAAAGVPPSAVRITVDFGA